MHRAYTDVVVPINGLEEILFPTYETISVLTSRRENEDYDHITYI